MPITRGCPLFETLLGCACVQFSLCTPQFLKNYLLSISHQSSFQALSPSSAVCQVWWGSQRRMNCCDLKNLLEVEFCLLSPALHLVLGFCHLPEGIWPAHCQHAAPDPAPRLPCLIQIYLRAPEARCKEPSPVKAFLWPRKQSM